MNFEKPYFSIVVPNFNRSSIIVETLDSVKSQTFQNWECIIIDDGSTDDSKKTLEKYVQLDLRFKFFERNRLPKGGSTCRNIGWLKAAADFVIFLDSDDLLMPWCLEERKKAIENSTKLDMYLFQGFNIYKNKAPEFRGNPELKDYLQGFLTFQTTFQTTAPVWRKLFLEKIGGWMEGISIWDDPELHCRAILNDAKIDWCERCPDYLIRADNQDDGVKLSNFSKAINRYPSRLYAYKSVYDLLKGGHKELFKTNVKNQTWEFSGYYNKKSLKLVAKNMSEIGFYSKIEGEKFKFYNILYYYSRRIKFLKGLSYCLIKKNFKRSEKYSIVEDPIAREAFNEKINAYFSDLSKTASFLNEYIILEQKYVQKSR